MPAVRSASICSACLWLIAPVILWDYFPGSGNCRTARPHWIVIDEAHHLLPSELHSASLSIPSSLGSFALITVHPKSVSKALLDTVNCVIALGPEPAKVIEEVNEGSGKAWAPPE